MKIRKATGKDRAAILKLDQLCFPSDVPLEFKPEDTYWVAPGRGRIVAYAGVREVNGGYDLYVHRMGTAPEARGRGLQLKFLETIAEYASSAGYRKLLSYTSAENLPSCNNFIRAGYEMTWPSFRWDMPGNWLYWMKSVA